MRGRARHMSKLLMLAPLLLAAAIVALYLLDPSVFGSPSTFTPGP